LILYRLPIESGSDVLNPESASRHCLGFLHPCGQQPARAAAPFFLGANMLLISSSPGDILMAKLHLVYADWDAEAGVWVATSQDVPGLITEAPTMEQLTQKLDVMVPELLDANGVHKDATGESFELIARRVAPLQRSQA